ncbi:MAG TPA: HNH endonuclease [Cytophagales bacterium]|nr:HNH endonuclease [Cytophagales bacterium]HAA22679.1 HNH endonuclease [Cytophagales bacterium]HAP58009.1 HNH endonuclease [Cytophagales bacterium]
MASEQLKRQVWNKAKKVVGKDPKDYRLDPYGNEIYYYSYGKNSDKGWEIDHIKPKSLRGSDHITNLQALKTSVNREKSNSLVKKSRHSKSNK